MDLCRRLSTATGAGIDTRQVWAREADRAVGPLRRHLLTVSEGVSRGEGLAESLAATDDFFPPLFRELIDVGEQTGNLDGILAQLAEHYQSQLSMRRNFLGAIALPLVELAITLLVIGGGIWVMGALNLKTDLFGFGLVGDSGLVKYVMFLAICAAAIWAVLRAINRGLVWIQPVQRVLLRLPAWESHCAPWPSRGWPGRCT